MDRLYSAAVVERFLLRRQIAAGIPLSDDFGFASAL